MARATTILAAFAVAACRGPQEGAEPARDLTLAPPLESVAVYNDRPQLERTPIAQSPRETAAQRIRIAVEPSQPENAPEAGSEFDNGERPTEPGTLAEPPAPPSLGAGYTLNLAILETIDTGKQGIGSPVSATLRAPMFSANGDLIVPVGAVFRGTISEVAASDGRVELAFTTVEFNDAEFPVETVTATVTSETEESEAQDNLPGRGRGIGPAIVDTRGQGIGRSPDGPVVVIRGGTGTTCDAPPGFFPLGTSTFRRVWARR